MFSKTEREYLEIVIQHQYYGRDLKTRFPNPSYSRKLAMKIRRKALDAYLDLQRYDMAKRKDKRLDWRLHRRLAAKAKGPRSWSQLGKP
jgi:hypothetical protein